MGGVALCGDKMVSVYLSFAGYKVAWLVHKQYSPTTFPILTSCIEAFFRPSAERRIF